MTHECSTRPGKSAARVQNCSDIDTYPSRWSWLPHMQEPVQGRTLTPSLRWLRLSVTALHTCFNAVRRPKRPPNQDKNFVLHTDPQAPSRDATTETKVKVKVKINSQSSSDRAAVETTEREAGLSTASQSLWQ